MRVFTRRLLTRNKLIQPKITNVIKLESGEKSKMGRYTSLVLGVMLTVSETLGFSERFESNGIIDMFKRELK